MQTARFDLCHSSDIKYLSKPVGLDFGFSIVFKYLSKPVGLDFGFSIVCIRDFFRPYVKDSFVQYVKSY